MEEKTIDPKRIGEKLRELRGNRTINAISEAIGISPSALTMYEIGARMPRDEIKIRICNYYGVSVEIFFKN